ncbi:MAG: cupin domain-containing protein [Deltaproteobacteria bacterium]|nr:cupin domain-containing protein [Deltaproteobacteria bacterium]
MHDGHGHHHHAHEDQPAAFPPAAARRLADIVAYAPASIVSREIVRGKTGTVTVFAFDKDQGLSEHTAPFDALVLVLDGTARLTIGGNPVDAGAGEAVLMPANVPHAVLAVDRFKMMLTMIRG